MNILILGGAKSGKSDLAQELALELAGEGRRYYVATMIPEDGEDQSRIRSHRRRREGMDFETVEQGRNILECLECTDSSATYLLDSVTSLLTNELFPREKNYEMDKASAKRCGQELLELSKRTGNLLLVADNLFFDASHYDVSTDSFRRLLGMICCSLAEICDVVLEMSCGNLIIHKGQEKFHKLKGLSL